MPIAIYVPALTFSQVSGVGVHTITPIVILICTFYTTVGGIKGVVWTDVIQSIVMYGSLVVLMIKGTIDLGGFDVIWQRNAEGGRLNAPTPTWDPTVRMSVISVFVGGTFLKLQNTSITQPTIQRFMSLPNLKRIKQALIAFSVGLVLLYLGCIYVGLVAYATFHDCDPMSTGLARRRDQVVPLLVMRVLGTVPGLPGLFVSAVFSAALSSLSTLLNSLAAVILEDLIRPNLQQPLSERSVALVMRTVVILFGLSSIGLVYLVEQMGMVMQLSATLQSVLYGPMLGIFTTGMLMPWVNEKSIFTGSILTVIFMSWVCINAQVAIVKGTFPTTKLPVSIDGCDYEFDITRYLNSTSEYEPKQGSAVHHISFLFYTMVGALLNIITSNLATLWFGCNNINDVDAKLITPFLVNWFRKLGYYKENIAAEEKIMLNSKPNDD